MKSRPRQNLWLSLIILMAAGCHSAEEAAVLPAFPYPDGGLADAYRKPIVDSASIADPRGTSDGATAIDVARLDTSAVPVVDASIDRPLSSDGASCPTSCDDNNPCTVDTCDPSIGRCSNTLSPENSACDNGCLTGGKGVCQLGICTGSPVADGTLCDDHNPCTTGDTCKKGLCYSGPDKSCPAADICHETGYCDRTTGSCVDVASKDGKQCDDGLMCTTGDRCSGGVCGGVALACAVGGVCSADSGVCKAGDRVVFPSATLAVQWSAVHFDAPGTLALGPQGDLFVVGTLWEATDLGAGTIVKATAGPDLLIAKVDPTSGRAVWARAFGDNQKQLGSAIAVNGRGQVAVSGVFQGSMAFGKTTISCPASEVADPESFVAALDARTGEGLWAIRPLINGKGLSVATDPTSGDFLVCGTAIGRAPTGLVPLAPATSENEPGDIVVARLDASKGTVVWGRQIVAPGAQTCDGVAVDGAGHVFLAGTLTSPTSVDSADAGASANVDLGSGIVLQSPPKPSGGVGSASASVIWLATLDVTDGKALNAVRFGEMGTHVVKHVLADSSGHVMVAGGFRTRLVVGASDLSSGTMQSAFVAKLDGKLTPIWARSWSGAGAAFVSQLANEPGGTVMMTGKYTTSLDCDGVKIAPDWSSGAGFVARLDATNGKVLSARGYGAPGAGQDSTGLQVVAAGDNAGTIWYAGVFTGTLQLGPPAESLVRGQTVVSQPAFIGRLAP